MIASQQVSKTLSFFTGIRQLNRITRGKKTKVLIFQFILSSGFDFRAGQFQFRLSFSPDFILHQSVASESLSVDTFDYKNDVYVTIAAPSTDSCMVFQWDHIEMNFRTYDNITGTAVPQQTV